MRRFAISLVTVLLVMTNGCGEDEKTTTGPDPSGTPEYLARTSPENVLHNLELAYEARDIAGYRAQMDEAFIFQPNADDPDVDFEQLGYEEDQESTANMFNEADAVALNLDHPAAVPSDRMDYPADDGYRQILVNSVTLQVTTREIIQGEPLILQVAGDPATFIFVPDETQDPVTWKIVLQQDDS